MSARRQLLILPVLLLSAVPSLARPVRCDVRVTRPVAAVEDPDSIMQPGEAYGPITQVRINRKTGAMIYCAHGSYCYPASALELRAPCRISGKPDPNFGDPSDPEGDWLYAVE